MDDSEVYHGDILRDQDTILFTILRRSRKKNGQVQENKEETGYSTDCSDDTYSGFSEEQHIVWEKCAHYKREEIKILKRTGRVCEVRVGSGNDVVVRDIKFESYTDAQYFQDTWKKMEQQHGQCASQC
jgi:hypothetical protein